jgi:hypothetical protein
MTRCDRRTAYHPQRRHAARRMNRRTRPMPGIGRPSNRSCRRTCVRGRGGVGAAMLSINAVRRHLCGAQEIARHTRSPAFSSCRQTGTGLAASSQMRRFGSRRLTFLVLKMAIFPGLTLGTVAYRLTIPSGQRHHSVPSRSRSGNTWTRFGQGSPAESRQ